MPPQECVDKGCDARMTKLEDQLEHIENPESGALGQLHEKLNSKVSFQVFIWVVAGSFAFTSLAAGALYTSRESMFNKQDKVISDANSAQDKRIEEALNEVRAMRMDLDATRQAANEAKASIDAHRLYTEGFKKKER